MMLSGYSVAHAFSHHFFRRIFMSKGLGVLLVDDDPGIRSALTLWAQLEKVRLYTFETAEAFLFAQKSGRFSFESNPTHGEPITHALIDLTLPGMSGDRFIDYLRPLLPLPRLALITAKQFELHERLDSDLRKVRVMRKPFALSDLDDFIAAGDVNHEPEAGNQSE